MNQNFSSAFDVINLLKSIVSNANVLQWFILLCLVLAIVNLVLHWYRAIVSKRLAYAVAINSTPLVIVVAVIATCVVGFNVYPKIENDSTFGERLQMCIILYAVTCGIMSTYTFFLMAADKWNAISNRRRSDAGKTEAWRIPERLLHQCEFFGGWGGSLIAQQLCRHKVSKSDYQLKFWSIFAIHAFACAAAVLHLANWSFTALICVVLAGVALQVTQALIRGRHYHEPEDEEVRWNSDEDDYEVDYEDEAYRESEYGASNEEY